MGNINLQRYHDSIGHSGKSFFNKWYRKEFEKFIKSMKTNTTQKMRLLWMLIDRIWMVE